MITKFKILILSVLLGLLMPARIYAVDLQNRDKAPCSKFLTFGVRSIGFNTGDEIPERYVCEKIPGGENKSIPLVWTGAPTVTKSFAILMYDTNPVANNFIHWAVIDIPADEFRLREGVSGTNGMPEGSLELVNSAGKAGYIGPCPPSGTGKHEYKIIVYALSTKKLNLSGQVSLEEFEEAVKNNVFTKAEISGYYGQ